MIKTLRRKFVAVTMTIVMVCLAVIFTLTVHFTAQGLRGDSEQFLRTVASEGRIPVRPGQSITPCFLVRVTPWGSTVEQTMGFDLSDGTLLNEVVSAALSGPELGELKEYNLRYLRKNGLMDLTIVFADTSGEQAVVGNLAAVFSGIGLAALAGFWVLSVLLARWMVKPVERAWSEQRQFVADASHELKTPLTVIMTSAELLESPEGERILTMSRRMRSLVERLLELARVDGGNVREVFSPVDLSALVEEELLPFEPMYFERGLELQSNLEPGVAVSGSDSHLRQVLGILLDNAMKYTPGPGAVWVWLRRQGNQAVLTVSNPGEALSREDCKNIFRRFYRLDQARTGGGYGLGLPIAQGIVTSHGGKIHAESYDGWNVFTVQLPLQKGSWPGNLTESPKSAIIREDITH